MSQEPRIVLTPAGYEKLSKRLDHLRNVLRPDVAERLRASKQFGELTENAEYEDAKTEQALVESQINEIRSVLQMADILDHDEVPTDRVGIGSRVKLTNLENKDVWELQLVTSFEAEPDEDMLSNDSPIGSALENHVVGDTVTVRAPSGVTRYRIEAIGR